MILLIPNDKVDIPKALQIHIPEHIGFMIRFLPQLQAARMLIRHSGLGKAEGVHPRPLERYMTMFSAA
jgi:hypothetical protein